MEFREYKINDLFEVSGIKRIIKPNYISPSLTKDYSVALISQSPENNQVIGFVNSKVFEAGGCLTVDSFSTGKVFYQKNNFVAIANQFNSKMILKNKLMSENIGLFLKMYLDPPAGVYSRGNQRGVSLLLSQSISLPSVIHDDGTFEPDWDYMENYISELKKKVNIYTQDDINIIDNVKKHRGEKIDVSEWKEYKVGDIFDIKSPKTTRPESIIPNEKGKYEFISRTVENNGVIFNCDSYTENGNCISISGTNGIAFYHSKNFLACNNMSLISNKNMKENSGLFIVSILNQIKDKYKYGNERSGKALKTESIILPSIIHDDGTFEPDWDYMENYIKKLKGKI